VRIDVIDNAVDKLIETIEIRKKKANESTHWSAHKSINCDGHRWTHQKLLAR
jgi:hypothetical protein